MNETKTFVFDAVHSLAHSHVFVLIQKTVFARVIAKNGCSESDLTKANQVKMRAFILLCFLILEV